MLIDLDINFGAHKLGATDASQMNFEPSSGPGEKHRTIFLERNKQPKEIMLLSTSL